MNKYTFQQIKREFEKTSHKKDFEEEKSRLSIGHQIFLAREQAGMTQGELAKRIGTRQSNISRLEQGNYNFTVEMLEKIAQAFHFRLKMEFIPLKKAVA